ncbi:hypothetical protein STANM309S_04226 [Streptomyces tanashiensis]
MQRLGRVTGREDHRALRDALRKQPLGEVLREERGPHDGQFDPGRRRPHGLLRQDRLRLPAPGEKGEPPDPVLHGQPAEGVHGCDRAGGRQVRVEAT